VGVVLVVLDHLVVQLVGKLRRDDAIDHALIVRPTRVGARPSDGRDLRDEPAVRLDPCVPPLVAAVEIAELVAALGQPDRLRGLWRDAVLVPRDVPRNGDDELPHHAREGDDARARLAETLRDAADRAAAVAWDRRARRGRAGACGAGSERSARSGCLP